MFHMNLISCHGNQNVKFVKNVHVLKNLLRSLNPDEAETFMQCS